MKLPCLSEFQCTVYADGELSAGEAGLVMEHLENCPSCRTLVSDLREENRVLVDCLLATDYIEFELEDEALSAPQAHNLGVVRLAAFVLAMSGLLRPVLGSLEQLGLPETLGGLIVTLTYLVPAAISFRDSVLNNANWIGFGAIVLLGIVLFSRRSVLINSILSLLALLTVFSSTSYALDVRTGDKPVTVPSGETIDDTLVAAGDSVIIDGEVKGDLIAFARQVVVRGTVKGNLISFARRVEIEGTVEGSWIGFAQTLQTRGRVARNMFAFGQSVDVSRDATVGENATLFAAESTIEGNVHRDAFVRAGSVTLPAAARIDGNFNARVSGQQSIYISPDAKIGGRTDIQKSVPPPPPRYSTASFYAWQAIWLVAALITGVVLFRIAPALSNVNLGSSRELLMSVGVGFLALIALPIAAVIAAITLIGLPLGLISLALWLIATYLAKIVVAGFVGRSLLAKGGDSRPASALILLAGLVPIFIAVNLPYIGALINFLLIILGLGVLAIQTYKMPRWDPLRT